MTLAFVISLQQQCEKSPTGVANRLHSKDCRDSSMLQQSLHTMRHEYQRGLSGYQSCGAFVMCSDFKTSGMPLRNMVKDLKIVHTSAREAGLSLPITAATEKVHTDTAREEYEDWDMAVPYVVLGRSEKDMCGPRLGISDEQWGF